mgnify:CR=1 FL=1
MSLQYQDAQGNHYVRGLGTDAWIADGPGPGEIAREEAQDRINNPHLWAPRPEGLQRVGTGIADWFTGNKFDFDQRGSGKAKQWQNDLLYKSTGAAGGNTLAQDIVGGNVGAGSSPAALGFLKKVGSKLKEIWDRPIIAPTITKDEHDQLIQGGGGGVHNWQNTPHY